MSFIPTDVGLDSPSKVALQGSARLARHHVVHSGGNEPPSGSPNVKKASKNAILFRKTLIYMMKYQMVIF
jgi:hypothetical protein